MHYMAPRQGSDNKRGYEKAVKPKRQNSSRADFETAGHVGRTDPKGPKGKANEKAVKPPRKASDMSWNGRVSHQSGSRKSSHPADYETAGISGTRRG